MIPLYRAARNLYISCVMAVVLLLYIDRKSENELEEVILTSPEKRSNSFDSSPYISHQDYVMLSHNVINTKKPIKSLLLKRNLF